jgi:hypothetical protein
MENFLIVLLNLTKMVNFEISQLNSLSNSSFQLKSMGDSPT